MKLPSVSCSSLMALSGLRVGLTRFLLLGMALVITASTQSAAQVPARRSPCSTLLSPRPMNASSIDFKVLNLGETPLHQGYSPAPKVLVFQSSQAWAEFWRHSTHLDANLRPPTPPAIDFAAQTVIGLTAGSRPTGGYSIRVDRVERGGNRWLVHYRETVPDRGCLLTQAATTPAVFITIKKSTLPVEIKGQQVVDSCH